MEEDYEDEVQPWEQLHSNLKRGQKDFEPDETQQQNDLLNQSLKHMYTSLNVPRSLTIKHRVKIYYNGDYWRCELKGSFMQTIGIVKGSWCYLNEEEVIYLVERGTVDPIWLKNGKEVHMDLQSVYAICMTDVNRYQVYANLKRCGYIVQRYKDRERELVKSIRPLQWLSSLFDHMIKRISIMIFRPFTSSWLHSRFTSPRMIFESIQLQLAPKLKRPVQSMEITFDIYKPDPNFSKKSSLLPDFQIIVMDVSEKLPTASQLNDLFQRVEYKDRLGQRKLKDGQNSIILAVLDNGVINYMRLSQGQFINEDVIPEISMYMRKR
jgi:tRNA-splicing endonuclease subunit Sen54